MNDDIKSCFSGSIQGQNYYSYIPLLIRALTIFIDLLGQIQILENSCNRFGLSSSLYA